MEKVRGSAGERNRRWHPVTESSEDLLAGRRQPSLSGGDN